MGVRKSLKWLDESQHRLTRLFEERGVRFLDVNPHAALPWFVQACRSESVHGSSAATNELRTGLMLYDLPGLVQYWPDATLAAFSPDGKRVAVATGENVCVLELHTNTLIGPMRHSGAVRCVTFAPRGDQLATYAQSSDQPLRVQIWDSQRGLALPTGSVPLDDTEFDEHGEPQLEFSPDGLRLLVIHAAMYNRDYCRLFIRTFDSTTMAATGPLFAHHCQAEYVSYFCLSPDRTRLLVSRGLPCSLDANQPSSWPEESRRPQQYDLLTGQPIPRSTRPRTRLLRPSLVQSRWPATGDVRSRRGQSMERPNRHSRTRVHLVNK